MKKKSFKNYLLTLTVLLLGVLFVINFAGPEILKTYIRYGIGTCKTIPILCMGPDEKIIIPQVDEKCMINLILAKGIPKISVCVPRGFTVFEERIKKVYYKRRKRLDQGSAMYLLYEKPNFFIGLFPRLKNSGVYNDYEFIRRIMAAKLSEVENLTDAFFVIMKGIFIPDLGNQYNVKMAQINLKDKYGFINYNLSGTENYFDCNIFNKQGDYFKIYIKDKAKAINLDMLFGIIASVDKAE